MTAGTPPSAPHRVVAVVDTIELISAALSATGAPAQVVDWLLQYGVLVFSNATFAKLQTRLWRPKFDPYLSLEQRQSLLHDFNAAAHWVKIPEPIAAQTPLLITGDADLLEVPEIGGLRIVAPARASKVLGALDG